MNRKRTSSFRKLILLLSLARARKESTPWFPLCRVNECSHFVRCTATELNEIVDEGEIGAARIGKKEEAWRGSFALFLARPLFCPTKGGIARSNTNDHVGSELSKVNVPIEWLFTRTSVVESEFVCNGLSCNSDALF